MTTSPPSTMRRDIASAYLAAGAKVVSWLIVLGLVKRCFGDGPFAILAFVRATIGLLNYAAVGLAPAMVRLLSEARAQESAEAADSHRDDTVPGAAPLLSYATPPGLVRSPVRTVYANAIAWTWLVAMIASACLIGYLCSGYEPEVFRLDPSRRGGGQLLVLLIGAGTIVRLLSDSSGAVLQVSGRIAADNLRIAVAEIAWAAATAFLLLAQKRIVPQIPGEWWAQVVGGTYLASAALLSLSRWKLASRYVEATQWMRLMDWQVIGRLLAFGSIVMLGQLADYLYAPTDYILINWLMSPLTIAIYVPAVQIDAGLLLLVSGISAVLLPATALAHASGDARLVRDYYIRGTLLSTAILLAAAVLVWLLSPWIFRLWLGDPMRPTQAILPLVLIHTVVGGSSAVGRSILLGMGKVRPFTISVLIAGVSNVLLSYFFVRYFDWGLHGIIAGTIVVVVARCLLWMPWYVLRALREMPPNSGVSQISPVSPLN